MTPLALELCAREAAQLLSLTAAKGLLIHDRFGAVDYVALLDEAAPGFRLFGRCAALPALQMVIALDSPDNDHIPGIFRQDVLLGNCTDGPVLHGAVRPHHYILIFIVPEKRFCACKHKSNIHEYAYVCFVCTALKTHENHRIR